MFVGIVEGKGKILEKKILDQGVGFWIEYPAKDYLKIGDSIAVNGVCLTIVEFTPEKFKVQLVQETLNKTNLNELNVGEKINIENAAKIGDTIGGHLVQGHVDTTGIIEMIRQEGVAKWLKITFDAAWNILLVPKGFVTVDGMSLTVVEAEKNYFTVTLIPHTQEKTIAQYYQPGQKVNLEFDIFAKQMQKFMEHYRGKI